MCLEHPRRSTSAETFRQTSIKSSPIDNMTGGIRFTPSCRHVSGPTCPKALVADTGIGPTMSTALPTTSLVVDMPMDSSALCGLVSKTYCHHDCSQRSRNTCRLREDMRPRPTTAPRPSIHWSCALSKKGTSTTNIAMGARRTLLALRSRRRQVAHEGCFSIDKRMFFGA